MNSLREEVENALSRCTDGEVATIEHNLGIICSGISCTNCPLMISGVCLYAIARDEVDHRECQARKKQSIKDFSDDELLNELITRYDKARNGG